MEILIQTFELLKKQHSEVLWKKDQNSIFVASKTYSLSWWHYLGDVEELFQFDSQQLYSRIVLCRHKRYAIWYPPHEWKTVSLMSKVKVYKADTALI